MAMISPLELKDISIENNSVQVMLDFSHHARNPYDLAQVVESQDYVYELVPTFGVSDDEKYRLYLDFKFSNFADGISPNEQIKNLLLEAFNETSDNKFYWL
jgi:hypothetical protein